MIKTKSFFKTILLAFLFLGWFCGVVQAYNDDEGQPRTPFAIPELAQHIFSYLSDEDLRSTWFVSQGWKENAEVSLDIFFRKNGFLVIPSWLISTLHAQAVSVPLSAGNLLSQEELAGPCYKALFQEDLPEGEVRAVSLGHLLAALPGEGIYVKKGDEVNGTKNFLEKNGSQLQEKLKSLSKDSSYISFKDDQSQEQLKILSEKPHTIVITGSQLKASKDIFETWLETHLGHRVILSVGEGEFVKDNSFSLQNKDIPQKLRHLILKNPAKNINQIGDYFLYNCRGLISLDLRDLKNVTSIEEGFLYSCSGLVALDLNFPKVITIESWFLYDCRGLASLDLRNFKNVTTVKYFFLYGCSKLKSLDLSFFQKVEMISDGFMYGCKGLESLDLNPLQELKTIGYDFLFGCRKLPQEKRREIRAFLESRKIRWK